MRLKGYTIIIFVCVLYWSADSLWSYFSFEMNIKKLIFSEPTSCVDTFLLKVSPYQMVSRLMVLSLFGAIGILIVEFIIRKNESERKIRESEEKFRTLVTNTEEIIYMIDKDGTFLLSQGKGLSTINLKPNEEVGLSVFDLYSDYPEIVNSVREALSGKSVTSEILYNGIYFRSRYSPYRNEDGEVIGIIGLSINITPQKKAEKALLESERKFRLLTENSLDLIYQINHDGIFEYCSPASIDVLGFQPNELIGTNFIDYINKDSFHIAINALKQVNKGESLNRFDLKLMNQNGSTIHTEINAVPILENRKVVSIHGIIRDITSRKELEEQRHIIQKQESIGTLAGGIAHDFNNILGVIIGNISYALSQESQKGERYDVLIDVQKGANQAQTLTQQLLTFAKGGEPIKKIINLNQLIKEVASFVIRGTQSKCEYHLSENLWLVEADSGQINQVISNLVINADQAMPNGGIIVIKTENVKVTTDIDVHLATGKYVKISIQDQGVGIQNQHIVNIFDPYFTTKQKGSGLGLATTYSIIKRHGGHITVSSEMGKGTVFHIYLIAFIKSVHSVKKIQNQMHAGKGKILIMDDQQAILKMVARMLNQMGYETDAAFDGFEAIEKYRESYQSKNSFDLVILDLTIPGGMGGAKTITKLLKIDPNVKAIVSSGYSNDPIMANYEDYGFCGVMPKPYTKQQLSEALNKVFL